MSTDRTMNLRDFLLGGLASLPGTREFHLHALVSVPRKSNGLFPYAKPKAAREYVQDILLLLSEQGGGDGPRVIVSAVEACVYHNPATSCAVLYVSKVDSTGQGKAGCPGATGTLVRGLVRYYVEGKTRPVDAEHVWVQLFARAQGQYLFPNSSEWEGKKPLSDRKLCGWWKRELTRVVADVEKGTDNKEMKMKMYYILPGYTEEEAEEVLRSGSTTAAVATRTKWEYGHPYGQKEIRLPCAGAEEGKENLGHYIPWFEDDPKSRFIDEIAYATPPPRKRVRTEQQEDKVLGELGKVTVDEFWERMSFRQECVAGAVTGFFALLVSSKGWAGETPKGLVGGQVHKRVMTTLLTGVEFSSVERAIKATETVEGAIRGLCEEYEVYGRVSTSNGVAERVAEAQAVQVLTVRRRRKQ